MRLPCGPTSEELRLHNRRGRINPALFQQHLLGCPACNGFIDLLDTSLFGPALELGHKALEEQQAAKEERLREAQEDREWPGRIRKLRRNLRLSQREFAEQLGVARVTLVRWERGRQTPSALARRVVAQREAELQEQYREMLSQP